MKKEDIISYLKMFVALMALSPLVFGFWRLDFSIKESLFITGFTYLLLMLLGISTYNWLEHDRFSIWINHKINNEKQYDESEFKYWYSCFQLEIMWIYRNDLNSSYCCEKYKFLFYEGLTVEEAVDYFKCTNRIKK